MIDAVIGVVLLAIGISVAGVMLISVARTELKPTALVTSLATRSVAIGLCSGTFFGIAAVGYRGAALALETSFLMAGAFTLVGAQLLQSAVMVVFLRALRPGVLTRVLRAWRVSLFAGFNGAAASGGWFTAMAIEPVAHVRTLALIELLFSYIVSRRIFREKFDTTQIAGMLILAIALAVVTLGSR